MTLKAENRSRERPIELPGERNRNKVPETKYLILGGGMATGYAAKELVSHGLQSGELAIVSADTVLPYERPPLSKGFLSGKDDERSIRINGPDWYQEHGIEVRLNTVVEHVDPDKIRLRISSERNLRASTCCWRRAPVHES